MRREPQGGGPQGGEPQRGPVEPIEAGTTPSQAEAASDPRQVLTRPAPGPDRTVAYGDHPDQVLDLRAPAAGQPPRPPIVVIHGGFWRAEYDRRHTDPLAADLAARGWPVIQVEYRRTGAPDSSWPNTLHDLEAALAALPRLAPAVAAQPPLLLGHSAGGHLALWWAGRHAVDPAEAGRSAPDGRPRMAVQGVVALAPVADLAVAHQLDLGQGAVPALLGGDPTEFPDRLSYAQPALPPAVPVTVVHGDQDEQVPVTISQRWVAAARAAGGDVGLLTLPGVEHFGLIDPLSSAWSAVLRAIVGHC